MSLHVSSFTTAARPAIGQRYIATLSRDEVAGVIKWRSTKTLSRHEHTLEWTVEATAAAAERTEALASETAARADGVRKAFLVTPPGLMGEAGAARHRAAVATDAAAAAEEASAAKASVDMADADTAARLKRASDLKEAARVAAELAAVPKAATAVKSARAEDVDAHARVAELAKITQQFHRDENVIIVCKTLETCEKLGG